MESKSGESGLDELLRLSRQMNRVDQEQTRAAREQAERGKTVKELQQNLIELKASVALQQLKPFASPRVIEEVGALKRRQSTEGLRKLVLNIVDELETWAAGPPGTGADIAGIQRSTKTLAILIELLFSIE
jgi:hypothetical protein